MSERRISVDDFRRDPAEAMRWVENGDVVIVGDPAAPRLVISAPRIKRRKRRSEKRRLHVLRLVALEWWRSAVNYWWPS